VDGTTPVHKNLMKYKITDEKKQFSDRMLYRIQALKDFSDVKSGDLGGWVESENNLSQEGDCWVNGNAQVGGNAWVNGHANTYPSPCTPEKFPEFNFSTLPNEVSEVVIAGVRYKKETTWKKI
jgi:hypothetical protein